MSLMHLFPPVCLILFTNPILSVPLTTMDSPEFLLPETFSLVTPFIDDVDEANLRALDFSFAGTPDASLSTPMELLTLSPELGGSCPKRPEEAPPPLKLEIPDLLNVFRIKGNDNDNDKSLNAENSVNWDDEINDPCVVRAPYRLHVCCEGELGFFDGIQVYSIEDCVRRTYCIQCLSTNQVIDGFLFCC